ncbi:MAG: hypothetical protein ACXITV_09535 [Luteibaculaceae bacterium]
MKNFCALLFLFFGFSPILLVAQQNNTAGTDDLQVEQSRIINFNGKNGGVKSELFGETEDYILALRKEYRTESFLSFMYNVSFIPFHFLTINRHTKLCSQIDLYSKETLSLVKTVEATNKKLVSKEKLRPQFLDHKFVLDEDKVVLLYSYQKRKKITYKAQSIPLSGAYKKPNVKTIAEVKVAHKGFNKPYEILKTNDNKEFALIYEESSKKEETVVKTSFFTADLKKSGSSKVTLPIIAGNKASAMGKYTMLSDNEILAAHNTVIKNTSRSFGKKGDNSNERRVVTYTVYNREGESTSKIIEEEGKELFDLKVSLNSNGNYMLSGLYRDTETNQRGKNTTKPLVTGIYTAELNHNLDVENTVLQPIKFKDEETELFGSKAGKVTSDLGNYLKGRKKNLDENVVNFSIANEIVLPNDEKVFILESSDNYLVTSCNGESCHTYPLSVKGDIVVVKLNAEGEVIWANTIERRVSYGSWYFSDLKALWDSDNLAVFFSNSHFDQKYLMDKEKKRGSYIKSKQLPKKYSPVFVSEIDLETGEFDVKRFKEIDGMGYPSQSKFFEPENDSESLYCITEKVSVRKPQKVASWAVVLGQSLMFHPVGLIVGVPLTMVHGNFYRSSPSRYQSDSRISKISTRKELLGDN